MALLYRLMPALSKKITGLKRRRIRFADWLRK
jgi:hypothetical protein